MGMKRIVWSLIMLSTILLFAACDSNSAASTVKDGNYVLEQIGTNEISLPSVTVYDEDISFTYDVLSSYLPIGNYSIEDNILIMTTNDEKYKYVFLIDGNKLVFQKDESSQVNLTDDRFGIKIKDNAIFKLKY